MKSSILSQLVCSLLIIVLVICLNVQGQSSSVSSKLDFDDTEDKNNSSSDSVPVVPGVVQGRTDGHTTEGGTGGSGSSGGGTSSDSKSRPKIHGVRVTVDTGDTQKSKESKESVEITDVGKHKKRVGIHTDITFEITANGDDDGNATSSAQRSDTDKEDASVPIFKGRGGSTHKPRKPHDPKTHWNPSYSAEGRGYEGTWRSGSGSPSYAGYYPHYPHNVPVYTSSGGDSRGTSGTIYRRGDGWNSYVPNTSRWTTERSVHYDPHRPNAVTGYRVPSWKPCYCITANVDNRRRRESSQDTFVVQPTSSVVQVVDAKLESPYSK